jgi:hypothetical protein
MRRRFRHRALAVAVAFGALVCVACAFTFWARAHGRVTADSLTHSVERESGSQGGLISDSPGCLRGRDGVWVCDVIDSGSSGTASYRVRVGAGSCWTGRIEGHPGEPMPERIAGCVLRRD